MLSTGCNILREMGVELPKQGAVALFNICEGCFQVGSASVDGITQPIPICVNLNRWVSSKYTVTKPNARLLDATDGGTLTHTSVGFASMSGSFPHQCKRPPQVLNRS